MASRKGKNSAAIDLKFLKILNLQSSEIRSIWYDSFRQKCGRKDYLKLLLIFNNEKNKQDILDFLLKILKGNIEAEREDFFAFLNRSIILEFSISNFFLEVSCLEESIERTLKNSTELTETEFLKGFNTVRNRLSKIFASVLKKSSEINEILFNASGRCFCRVDSESKIIYTNSEFKRLLGIDTVAGMPFDSFFEGEERVFIRKALSGSQHKDLYRRTLNIKINGKKIQVFVTIGSISIDGEHLGGYAEMMDVSLQTKMQERLYDILSVAIIKVNLKGQITYANPSALNIFEIDTLHGRNIRDFVRDEKNYAILKDRLSKRFSGNLITNYELELNRYGNGKKIPVEITAAYETDIVGKIIGSFAMLRSIVREKTSERIRSHIESYRNAQDILREVAKEISNVIPFDILTIWVYSSDMRYRRQLLSYSLLKPLEWPKGWLEMPEDLTKWGGDKEIVIDNLENFLNQFPSLKQEPEIQILQKDSFRSVMRRTVMRNKKVIATITLSCKRESAFNREDVDLLRHLPLDSAVFRALDYGIQSIVQVFISYEKEDTQFAHRLADDLRGLDAQIWIAPESIRPGESWVDAINRALEESRHTLIVLSPAAVQSRWVRHETNSAIALERKGLMEVIPLILESCEMPPLWNNYQMISFQQNYKAGFKKLVKILGLFV